MTPEQEFSVIRRVLNGEPDAFGLLVNEYERTAYNIALRMVKNREDAEDLTQEAFLKAYRSLSSFREESKFSAWFFRILSNLCLDRLRSEKNRNNMSLSLDEEDAEEGAELQLPDDSFSPERLLDRKLTNDAVKRGLDSLPPDYREVLLLRELRGMSYDEIGEALDLEAGTVKSRIFRARKRLCAFLVEDGNIPDKYTSEQTKGGA